jgi:hypothetical protein
MTRAWEVDFVAMSVALGEPMSAVVEALGPPGVARAGDLVQTLHPGRAKSTRALALATALAEVLTDLEEMEMR